MWQAVGRFILKYRWILLCLLIAATVFMTFHALRVELSYEFSRAIPTDNPKYVAYQDFRQQFGEDGNMLVIGIQTENLFSQTLFNDYTALTDTISRIEAVEDVLSIPTATNLVKDTAEEKLLAVRIFPKGVLSQQQIDTGRDVFLNLPFYDGLLYNHSSQTYLIAVRIDKNVLNSERRSSVVGKIVDEANAFGARHKLNVHFSGLPLIRTSLATRIQAEMRWFLLGSLLLSAIILLVFFQSISSTLLSLAVVVIGVIWSLGTIELLGYKITLLTALIPPLVVVIGIPNCIYFLNKYHTAWKEGDKSPVNNPDGAKHKALIEMVSRMGIVTLFCNIAAAIGFAVFALTKSAILKEFGIVAGINILALFFISLILIPVALSILPSPNSRQIKYLENRWLLAILDRLEIWSLHHQRMIYAATLVVIAVAVVGMFRLRSEGFIVDDLPQSDKIYTDLKFFERHFEGVMPLEIVVDTRRKNGLRSNPLQTFEKIDSLSAIIEQHPQMARPLSIVEGMKFARQAYYDGDSTNYGLPNSFDIGFLSQYLSTRRQEGNNFSRLVNSFMDSSRQQARVSINMADVGSKRLEAILDSLKVSSEQLFDSSRYQVRFTGSSVTFLEGSTFIINGLKESIFWAFLLIALCMLYLFRSLRILICSLVPNVIPLIITAGVMGWVGVRIKPSTVLIFSVALGIAIDITIRFLVSYRQELRNSTLSPEKVVIQTIHKTGISIIYTSVVLIAGFVIFCFSGFGGTQSLGWLTSFTLILATVTNLVFLPALLLSTLKRNRTVL